MYMITTFAALMMAIVPFVAIIEFLLSGFWNRVYFMYGIPIFRRRYLLASRLEKPAAEMIENLLRGKLPHRMLLNEFNPAQYGFRYTFLHLGESAVPVMHGLLEFDETAGALKVTGYANWFILPVAIAIAPLLLIVRSFPTFVIAVCMFLVGAWLYREDSKAFTRVGEVTRDAWQGTTAQTA